MHRDPQQFERTIQFSRTERKVRFRRGGRYIRFGGPYCQSKISFFSIRFGLIQLMDGSRIFPQLVRSCEALTRLPHREVQTGDCKDQAMTACAVKRLRRFAAHFLTYAGAKVHLYISNLTAALSGGLSHTLCPQAFHVLYARNGAAPTGSGELFGLARSGRKT